MKTSTIALIIGVANGIYVGLFNDPKYFIVANIFFATALICSSIEKTKK